MAKKNYPAYRDSGIDWLAHIPELWQIKRAKWVFREVDFRSETGNEELLSVSEHFGVIKRKNANVNMFKAASYIGYKLCNPGDLVINSLWAWSRGLGFSKYHGIVSTAYGVYRPNQNEVGDYQYFHYLLRTKMYVGQYAIRSKGIWISRLQLSDKNFLDIPILIPPKKEQTAIARFLDYKLAKINRFIHKKKQLIKLLNEQKTAITNQAVTKGLNPDVKMKDNGIEWLGEIPEHWEVRKLKYVANCFPSNIDKHSNEDEKQVRLCNYTDVYKNDYITDSMDLMLATATDEQIAKFTLLQGDVIITKDSETANDIAVPAYVKEPLTDVVCGYHLSVLRPYETLYGEFLFRALQCKEINIQFEVRSNGVTRVGLGVYDLKNAKIPVPPINEQTKIVEFISKETSTIYSTISKIEKEIALVEEYKTALITEAVTGKIDVRAYEFPETETEDEGYEELEEELALAAEESEDYQTEEMQ